MTITTGGSFTVGWGAGSFAQFWVLFGSLPDRSEIVARACKCEPFDQPRDVAARMAKSGVQIPEPIMAEIIASMSKARAQASPALKAFGESINR